MKHCLRALPFVLALVAWLLLSAPTFAAYNPAALYCTKLGYSYEVVDIGIGQQGICRFSSDYEDFCDEWDFYNGDCARDKGNEKIKEQASQDSQKEGLPPTGSFIEPVEAAPTGSSQGLPTSFDWRTQGVVTTPKNQMKLGTCWAFSKTGAVEARNNMDNGNPQDDLSEQDVVSCCKSYFDSAACISSQGITDEDHFPYYGSYVPCSLKKPGFENRLWKTSGWSEVEDDNEAIKEALVSKGPLDICINAKFRKAPSSSSPGVECEGVGINHAVLLVGYNDERGVWILKNSYGPTWGDRGFFEIPYGQCSVGAALAVNGVYSARESSGSGDYCKPRISNANDVYMAKVELDENERSTQIPLSYNDLTSPPLAHLELGQNYDLSVTAYNRAGTKETVYVKVWIDSNKDGIFSEEENIFSESGSFSGVYTFENSFALPSNTQEGEIRMRVYLSVGSSPQPCDSSEKGEVEDYTVSVSDKYAECMPIDESLPLDRDLVSDGNCIKIQADDIVLDCAGHTISYGTKEGSSYGIYNSGHENVVIKNCNIIQDGNAQDSHAIYFLSGADGASFLDNNITIRGDNSHGIYLQDVKRAMAKGNQIILEGNSGGGTGNHGISLITSEQSRLDSNTITLNGKNTDRGIYIHDSNFNTMLNNHISLGAKFSGFGPGDSPQHSEGISLEDSEWNYVESNIISCTSAFGTGISLKKSSNNNLMKNYIEMHGDESGAIRDIESSDKIFGDNKISVNGKYAYGIWSTGRELSEDDWVLSMNTNLTSNEIYVEGDTVRGIVSSYFKNGDISRNDIDAKGDNSVGIEATSTQYSNYSSNRISVDGDMSLGIHLDEKVENTEYKENNLIVSGVDNTGILIDKCPSNRFVRNSLSLYGEESCTGIDIGDSNDNVIDENKLRFYCFGWGIINSDCNNYNVTNNSISAFESIQGIESSNSKLVYLGYNNLVLEGDDSTGITSSGDISSNISGNSVTIKGEESKGIEIKRVQGSVTNNSVSSLGESSIGLVLVDLLGVPVLNNSVSIKGKSSQGVIGKKISGINLTENHIEVSAENSRGIEVICERSDIIGNNLSGVWMSTEGILISGQRSGDLGCSGRLKNDISRNNIVLNGWLNTGILVLKQPDPQPAQEENSEGSEEDQLSGVKGGSVGEVKKVKSVRELSLGVAFCGDRKCEVGENSVVCPVDCENVASKAEACSLFANVSGNKLSFSGSSNVGIVLYNDSDDEANGNEISFEGQESYGVWFIGSTRLNFTSNKINTSGNYGIGISLATTNNTLVKANEISTSGTSSSGVQLTSSTNATLKENKIDTKNGYALFIEPSTNKSDYNHSIDETNTEAGKPIQYYFDQKNLEVQDKEGIGQLYIAFCQKPRIENIKNSIDGITIANSNYSKILNCNLTYSGCNVSGIFLINLDHSTINDSFISSSCENTAEVSLWNATNISFINTTYDDAYFFTENSYLERWWYFGVNVIGENDLPVGGAEVSCKDANGKEAFREKADYEGKIKQRTLPQYNQTGVAGINGGLNYRTPYEIKVTKEGYQEYLQKLGLFQSYILQVTLAKSDIS